MSNKQNHIGKANKMISSVDWLFYKLWDTPKDKLNWHSILKQAKEMEKQQIIGPVKKRIRIWLPDSVEKEGGIWVNCTVHDATTTTENVIIEEGHIIDIDNTLESFDGYLIEELI